MEDLWELQALTTAHEHVPESLFASHPEQARTLALLHDVSRELTSILDREELLRRVAQRVKRLVDYDVFSVMLWNERSRLLESAFAARYDDTVVLTQRLTLEQGLCGASAKLRRAVRVGDVLLDARYIRCESGVDIRSELVVPLHIQDRLVGVLDLESVEPNAFTLEHERMMMTLGSYVAIALENARLFEHARENERRLQLELDTAREIQQRLLPAGAREVPGLDLGVGYLPARELGGDFYDFLATGTGRLAIAAGDVSGKGTAAALFGSLAIGMLREHILEHPCPPAEMLAMLNRGLHSGRLDGRFIALTFAVYDALARQLTLANAGQPWPLLFRDGVTRPVELAGIPLGLFPGSQYDEMTLHLVPGDIVLFASDGVFESESAAGEQFGQQRAQAVLASLVPQESAAAVAEGILRATDEHTAGTPGPADDRTIIVLRVTDEPLADTWSKLPVIY
jgi:sigma-B regulation protein RsbU (phosphoserine phosphatase)